MKELSIEEKAKRYDEAIERAKNTIEVNQTIPDIVECVESLFPALKESEDERIRKVLIHIVKGACSKYGIKYQGKEIGDEKLLAWFEKQGEQKPTNKVEPKFNVGDWVVCCDYKPEQIINIRTNVYEMSNGDIRPFYMIDNNHNIRLWTIQDAKDGDVLKEDSCIFIIEKMNPNGTAIVHCCLFDDGDFDLIGSALSFDVNTTYPATKEQRDLLFSKMKEAGYEWDAEKKELRKIEQNPANVFNIYEKSLLEKFKQAVYDCAWGKVTCKKEGETKEEYAERWAEHFLLMVRDWADDYIDFTIQEKLRNSYEKGKKSCN